MPAPISLIITSVILKYNYTGIILTGLHLNLKGFWKQDTQQVVLDKINAVYRT